jgi:lipopolysaccharide transport system ATP-binding protein
MSNLALRVENLSKRYRINLVRQRYGTLRDEIADGVRSLFRRNGRGHEEAETFWALRDVSFDVKHGEVVGIIGRNGAGKSTLLKVLSRITEPTRGRAMIHGRVASLLEVGIGFHGELSGRENIYLNGAILGMKKAEIDRKFDEIVAFSEVEKFIDTPVKRYSSGMYVRLAFAVAAHLEPEILIVDEVLAVGDAAFQKKCLGKMGDVADGGRTVLFVSHNMSAIAQICKRIVFLEHGRLRADGEPSNVIGAYLTSGIEACAAWISPERDGGAGQEFRFLSVSILSMDAQPIAVVDFDKPFQIEICYELAAPIKGLSIVYQVLNARHEVIWSTWDSDPHGWRNSRDVRERGRYASTCSVPRGLLRPGRYTLSVGAAAPERRIPGHANVLCFDISTVGFHLNPNRQGVITPLLLWKVQDLTKDHNVQHSRTTV